MVRSLRSAPLDLRPGAEGAVAQEARARIDAGDRLGAIESVLAGVRERDFRVLASDADDTSYGPSWFPENFLHLSTNRRHIRRVTGPPRRQVLWIVGAAGGLWIGLLGKQRISDGHAHWRDRGTDRRMPWPWARGAPSWSLPNTAAAAAADRALACARARDLGPDTLLARWCGARSKARC